MEANLASLSRTKKLERIRRGGLPRVLDLFSGAGGLSLGFKSAGFEIVAAVEIDGQAAMTHALNFFKGHSDAMRKIHASPRDITKIEPDELLRESGFEEPSDAVDVIIGGPPCQAFARVGRAKLREVADHPDAFLQDPRANLYLRFIHYVRELSPLAILMENVPDALNHGGHNIAEETCEVFESLGYRCKYTLLNAAYYGVPQMRERMFLVAYAEEVRSEVIFPEPTNWIELPHGYEGTRSVALKSLKSLLKSQSQEMFEVLTQPYFVAPPKPDKNRLPQAITAQEALGDLPAIHALDLLEQGLLKRGVQDPNITTYYNGIRNLPAYAYLMRNWCGFKTSKMVTGHVIRYLPRDYKLFAKMKPGDQYPEAYQLAQRLFQEEYEIELANIDRNSSKYEEMKAKFVPPYDPGKFPNKWRKMEPDRPARTLMAHIGKDSYSHIHYDSNQARTISMREAARLQSFPDGFLFEGKMNSALKQIGNAVPPLLAYRIASKIKTVFGQTPYKLVE